MLSNYKLIFPNFTDHTELHSLNVIDFCNRIIGGQIEKLNQDEIYTLLLGCYFHDTGMGISKKDFDEFSAQIDFGNYFETHDKENLPEIIRSFHNEYTGLFIKKYSKFFEFPSVNHMFVIMQISRGHRKTNLEDPKEYPLAFEVPNGNTICLPYLAALVRLADELDVAADRNPQAIYDLNKIVQEKDLIEFMKHEAVRDLVIKDKEFVMKVSTNDEKILKGLKEVASKMQKTLDQCRSAVNGKIKFEITQERVVIEKKLIFNC
ncbi:MAG: HD domain-containing protein [Bacilli bacterium]|nr:HD domain-containing protein [Bacilli bacterium]